MEILTHFLTLLSYDETNFRNSYSRGTTPKRHKTIFTTSANIERRKDDFQAPFSPMDRVKMTRYVVKPIISSAYKQCPFNSFFRAFRYSFIAEEFSKIPTFREELKYLLGDRRWSRIGARKYRENELLQQFFVLR